eukprot:1533578-Prymnesium_polylepis.1
MKSLEKPRNPVPKHHRPRQDTRFPPGGAGGGRFPTIASTIGTRGTPSSESSSSLTMWVPDLRAILGTFFACPPGMTGSSEVDYLAPGISPCPLRGSRPTQGRLHVPRLDLYVRQ